MEGCSVGGQREEAWGGREGGVGCGVNQLLVKCEVGNGNTKQREQGT